jgi:hypothetical protein
MMNERFIYTDDESSGTWTVVGLVLGVIVVTVALYFGGVFGQTAGDHQAWTEMGASQPSSQIAR